MNKLWGWVGGCGCLALMIVGIAIFGIVGFGFQSSGESPDQSSSTVLASSGTRWRVVQLPPTWKQFYSDTEFEALRQTMQEVVDQYKLPADEFMGLLDLESSGNPNVCSRAGARGLGQFMDSTARTMPEFGSTADERAANICNPIRSMRATGAKVSADRRCDGGSDWGTLKDAYLGIKLSNGNYKCPAYNPGTSPSDWTKITDRAKFFRDKGYVVPVTDSAANVTIDPNNPLGPNSLKQISQPFLDLEYGRNAHIRREEGPICLDCQTLVERTIAEALVPRFGSLGRAVDYLLTGADPVGHPPKGGRIQTPIPGWLYEPYGWPARDVTAEVARSSGIESHLASAQWIDFGGGLGQVNLQFIPWDQIGNLKGNDTIDGTIIAFLSKPISNGVPHVGFLFNENGKVIIRNATSPSRGILDEPLADRRDATSHYTGIILLRPDISKLKGP